MARGVLDTAAAFLALQVAIHQFPVGGDEFVQNGCPSGRHAYRARGGVVTNLAAGNWRSKRISAAATQAIDKIKKAVDDDAFIGVIMARQDCISAPDRKRPLHPDAGAVRPRGKGRVVKEYQLPALVRSGQFALQPGSLRRSARNSIRLVGVTIYGKQVDRPPTQVVIALVAGQSEIVKVGCGSCGYPIVIAQRREKLIDS